ncbi:MAG: site-2 protease family protein [Candidatus Omnitrophica bacterium]|nr:site-2 protease family protein [Candidatus Omnitrophota bacterium]
MRNVKLFTLFGIPLYIHITFLILPVLFYFNSGPKGVFLVLFVFACVTLHELSHSLTARHYGVQVRGITLFPIGGVASITSYPKKPGQEFLIALAGPMFNIIFTIVLFYPLYRLLGPDIMFRPSLRTWPNTFAYAFWINPMLAIFNLLPAFPMDGGRILRSFLARRLTFRRATEIAVGIGHFFALVFGIAGILQGNIMLVVIAIFIYMAASSEEFQVELMENIKETMGDGDSTSINRP